MVMKLSTKVVISYPNNDEIQTLSGCAGYVPVYDNIEDAEKESCDGKYQIIAITTIPK